MKKKKSHSKRFSLNFMSYKSFEKKNVFRFGKKYIFKSEEKTFWNDFFFCWGSLLTCYIFNMQHFSHHFNVKNGLISKKFEVLKFI
jgi:hypothetical protein